MMAQIIINEIHENYNIMCSDHGIELKTLSSLLNIYIFFFCN